MNLSNNFACNHFRPNGISFFYSEFRLLEMAMSLQATERCTLYTHFARIHTRKWSRACGSSCSSSHWSVLCVRCLQSIQSLACMPCFARCLTRHWLHLHIALLPHLLCCSLYTGLPLPLRKLDSCLADLPNSLRSHSERVGNQSWFCQRYRSDSKLWMSWRSQEPVLSITKSRSFTCSFPRPRTYRKRASQSAWVTNRGFTSATDSGSNWGSREDHTTGTCAVKHEEQIVDMLVSQTKDIPHEGVSERIGNKSWFYPRPWFGRKLWNCGSYAVHSTRADRGHALSQLQVAAVEATRTCIEIWKSVPRWCGYFPKNSKPAVEWVFAVLRQSLDFERDDAFLFAALSQ